MLFLWYPKCTTCQKAKAFLDERGVSYEARDIKLENPTAEELRGWWEKSGMPLKKFFNTSGLQYKALGLKEIRRKESEDFTIVFLGDGLGQHLLELTWLKGHPQPYDLGENEFHLAFETDDMDAALAHHKEMDCVCFENPAMGIYFISDPDGYWLEIVPKKD